MILIQLGMRCVFLSALTLVIAPGQLPQECDASQLRHFFHAQAPTRSTLHALERLFICGNFDYLSHWVASRPSEDFLDALLEVSIMKGRTRVVDTTEIPPSPSSRGSTTVPIAPRDLVGLQRLLPITLLQSTPSLIRWTLSRWEVLRSIVILGVDQLMLSEFSSGDQERILQAIIDDPIRQQVSPPLYRDRSADTIWTVGSVWRLFDGPCAYYRIQRRLPVTNALNHIEKLARGGNLLAKIRLATIHRHAFTQSQWTLLSAMCIGPQQTGAKQAGSPCGDQLGFALQSFADISGSASTKRTPTILSSILQALQEHTEIGERDRIAFSFELLSAALIIDIGSPEKSRRWIERMISDLLTQWSPSQVSPYSARSLLSSLDGVTPAAGFPPAWEEVRRTLPPTDHFPRNLLSWSTRLALWKYQVVSLADPKVEPGPVEHAYHFFANSKEYNEAVLARAAQTAVVREAGNYVSFRCTLSGDGEFPTLTFCQFRDDLELYWQSRFQLVALNGAPLPRLHPDLLRALSINCSRHQDIWEFQRLIGKSCWPGPSPNTVVLDTLYETLRDLFYRYQLILLYSGDQPS